MKWVPFICCVYGGAIKRFFIIFVFMLSGNFVSVYVRAWSCTCWLQTGYKVQSQEVQNDIGHRDDCQNQLASIFLSVWPKKGCNHQDCPDLGHSIKMGAGIRIYCIKDWNCLNILRFCILALILKYRNQIHTLI